MRAWFVCGAAIALRDELSVGFQFIRGQREAAFAFLYSPILHCPLRQSNSHSAVSSATFNPGKNTREKSLRLRR